MPESSPNFIVRLHQGGFDYAYLREIFRAADALEYDGASLYDLLGIPTLECWTTLSALATETERIRLIPLALANLYRHPATLAKMAATLDVISDGRLVLGNRAGGGEGDHKAYGLPYPSTRERARMLSEAARVIRLLWSGERVSFAGEYYRLDSALCSPAPAQQPQPPILIGGHGERHLLRVAAAHADITNMRADMSIAEHHAKRRVLHVHCRAVGRDPSAVSLSHNARVSSAKTSLRSMQCWQSMPRGTAFHHNSSRQIWATPSSVRHNNASTNCDSTPTTAFAGSSCYSPSRLALRTWSCLPAR